MPRITKNDSSHIRKIYDELAQHYDRREALLDLFFFKRYREQVLSQAIGSVLEIGMGTGKNLPYYPYDCEITGIDISTEMLRIAARRGKKLGIDPTLFEMDAQELTFPDQSFDTVISSLSLCTIVNPIQALSEMSRVLTPHGKILLLEHGRSQYPSLSKILDRFSRISIPRCGCHMNRNISVLVQSADLRILEIERHILGMVYLIECQPRDGIASHHFRD
jgi:ubiquinone/menaquinone biosynthesis C-methylase UbiE